MFHYKNLHVYAEAKKQYRSIRSILQTQKPDRILEDQLNRASLSILLNVVEGAGRHSAPYKKNFYIIARASVFEVSELIDLLQEEDIINTTEYHEIIEMLEAISKMLFVMIKVYSKK